MKVLVNDGEQWLVLTLMVKLQYNVPFSYEYCSMRLFSCLQKTYANYARLMSPYKVEQTHCSADLFLVKRLGSLVCNTHIITLCIRKYYPYLLLFLLHNQHQAMLGIPSATIRKVKPQIHPFPFPKSHTRTAQNIIA